MLAEEPDRARAHIGRYVAAGRQFVPDPGAAAILDRKYQLWRESYRRLQTMFPQLGTLAST